MHLFQTHFVIKKQLKASSKFLFFMPSTFHTWSHYRYLYINIYCCTFELTYLNTNQLVCWKHKTALFSGPSAQSLILYEEGSTGKQTFDPAIGISYEQQLQYYKMSKALKYQVTRLFGLDCLDNSISYSLVLQMIQ